MQLTFPVYTLAQRSRGPLLCQVCSLSDAICAKAIRAIAPGHEKGPFWAECERSLDEQ